MKRFVLSLVAASSVAASPLLAAGPAFAHDEHDRQSNQTSTVCSNGGLLQLQVVCIGTIAVPVVLNVLSGDNLFTNESRASNKGKAEVEH
jgi:hypothetical protein